MSGEAPRVYELERLVGVMQRRLDAIAARLAAVEQSLAKVWGLTGGQGGGGGAVYFVPSGVVIAAGSSNTADVYTLIGGSVLLHAAGQTIWNEYAVATTAGKPLTVGPNGDGTYLVLGQSC